MQFKNILKPSINRIWDSTFGSKYASHEIHHFITIQVETDDV